MPMHDWARVPDGIFHAFHHRWISSISDRLNAGLLPDTLYALPEQVAGGYTPDVLTLGYEPRDDEPPEGAGGGVALATAPVRTRPVTRFVSEAEQFVRRKSRIAVRHVSTDDIVALVEIVSPGNKASEHPLNTFVKKVREYLESGVHQLVLDPFAPGPRDPDGIHALVWEPFARAPFRLPDDARLTFVAYEADIRPRAYIEPTNVGAPLPNMPLFVAPGEHIVLPLEETYATAFEAQPRRWRNVLAPPGA
jgi:Protein of unknown function (DUF4058)